jgi:peptidoglycan hydrolase-like protein with peptidoglycan-binding domain
MSIVGEVEAAYAAWKQYGPAAERALTIAKQVVDAAEKALLANGIDVASSIAAAGGTLDLTRIKDIQAALNQLGARPQVAEDGVIGLETMKAVAAFQRDNSVDGALSGCPDAVTVAAIRAKLAAL